MKRRRIRERLENNREESKQDYSRRKSSGSTRGSLPYDYYDLYGKGKNKTEPRSPFVNRYVLSPFENNFLKHPFKNNFVKSPFRSSFIQPKLRVSEPGDRHEREADRIAGDIIIEETASTDAETIAVRLDIDSPSVNIHDDPEAHEMAEALNARAFTVGNDIVFNKGEYRPETDDGKKLLAHELVHVKQQKSNYEQIQLKEKKEMSPGYFYKDTSTEAIISTEWFNDIIISEGNDSILKYKRQVDENIPRLEGLQVSKQQREEMLSQGIYVRIDSNNIIFHAWKGIPVQKSKVTIFLDTMAKISDYVAEHIMPVAPLEQVNIRETSNDVVISPPRPDWGGKGAHIHVDNIELVIRIDENNNILFKAKPSLSAKIANKAIKRAQIELQKPEFRKKLFETIIKAIELIQTGYKIPQYKLEELQLLAQLLENMGL